MKALQQRNPGTSVEWEHHATNHPSKFIIKYVFWAFKPCIDGFKYCSRVISVDGTYLYTKYKHKMLLVVCLDANQQVLPLAYAIVDEETASAWKWFFKCIDKHLLSGISDGICIISDRGTGILSAIDSMPEFRPPRITHRFCLRHVCSNVNAKFKSIVVKDFCYAAGKQSQVWKLNRYLDKIGEENPNAHRYLMNMDREKWTLAHDGGSRRGQLTTNLSESINGALKGARKLPVTAIVDFTFHRQPCQLHSDWWTNHVSFIETGAHVLRIFRMMLDQMLPDQFIWMPYDMDDQEYQAVGGDSDIICSGICVSRVPLICYAIVEMHRPDRVVRQFGMVQPIPEPPENTETDFRMHVNAYRTGATNRDWSLTHVSHVTAWDNRLNYTIDYPYASDSQTTEDGYFEWYELHTRRFISPITPSDRTGFQVGGQISMDTVIQHLRSLIVSVDGGDMPRDGYRSYLPTLRTCLNVLESRHGPSDRPQSEMPYTQTHPQTQTQIPLSQMPQSQTQMYAGEAETSSRAYYPAFDNYTDPRSHGHPSDPYTPYP
ncbi:PREDICTED: uncharacterized protein LOC105969685 [Erythranthe guttata]|uniref:uncharacterized protein LOC105969685 n=1 Tax=Erythranthe guttata TaxID=4155 RepID=UPI00064D7F8D|nr:PREDICTED: uncharacterized protein LOC105969685 [Erythranthe guttata]|eukprot:XP_012849912.1 PREDICTED: uncharacterized protein LOC105969685 [Erythranthe guttata]